jgi:hypothetical protein
VSTQDDIAAAIDAAESKIEEALGDAQGIEGDINDATSTASTLGASATLAGLAGLSDEIQTLIQQLAAARDTAKDAATTARAVADDT